MTIKVIGAGFGRTGTDSMREALNILGFGPCHHMRDVNSSDAQRRLWRAFVQGEAIAWSELLDGYKSCVDWPTAYYWRELIVAYPEAKVLLTWRDPESWWASFEKTILAAIAASSDPQSLGIALIRDKVFGGRPSDKAHAISLYEDNVRAVRADVPKERLLVHNLGDGWGPLCAHLNVPVPAVPYPQSNATAAFRAQFLKSD